MKPETNKNWYAFYTKSRHEKKVKDLLERRGYEVFLPMQKVMRQWSDRKKKVEVPLFNSYIFVNTYEHQIPEVLQIPGISWSIRHNDKPAMLHPKEYDLINRFLATGLTIEVMGADHIDAGDKVKVMDGPLKGAFGQVTKANPNKFMVSLDLLGNVMRVELDPALLKKI
ncbi:MAG: UpxY family transcription antiterminator [Cyclobacteriaceae bacterium]|nr:UpxY family transcription antiterminator [Cyclobacteriaceae bacterium]